MGIWQYGDIYDGKTEPRWVKRLVSLSLVDPLSLEKDVFRTSLSSLGTPRDSSAPGSTEAIKACQHQSLLKLIPLRGHLPS